MIDTKKLKSGGESFVVYDPGILTGNSRLIKLLDEHGYECLQGYLGLSTYITPEGKHICMIGSWAHVNIDTKAYAIGRQGIAYCSTIGNHAINYEEFKTIFDIYQSYQDVPFLDVHGEE